MKKPEEIKKGHECCRHEWVDHHWKTCDVACPYLAEGSYCKNVLHHDGLAYIQQLEARVPRWIPVEERLPEGDDNVLVIVNGECKTMIFEEAYMLASYYPGEGWIVEGYEEWENPVVTHWIPLPSAEGLHDN